jgi:hypothetical protein
VSRTGAAAPPGGELNDVPGYLCRGWGPPVNSIWGWVKEMWQRAWELADYYALYLIALGVALIALSLSLSALIYVATR